MSKDYKDFEDDMKLQDYLSYDRTKLALTRTFLSFARTAIGLLASGAGLIILQESVAFRVLGYVILLLALLVVLYGIRYCLGVKKRLDKLEE